ncbi:hypothetical protein FKG94_24200 [Exilibacterium tricleocarpae]|uniref:Uncharacterized protein n=1 Tax=Exilibacterium tricleocarpae TaxID=2591008 RepID=A0A545ST97_9GAMM|nr:hypothetical protein [Exilibacterium tricleocarpae]TQV68190.1 hypothetical protein FKG94_24200 [Exilibacterium tricleocarpae]
MSDENRRDTAQDLESRRIARNSSRQAETNNARIEELERKLGKLSLITEALWEIVASEANYGEPELLQKIEMVVSDREQRLGKKLSCSRCNMLVAASKEKCIYCGAALADKTRSSPFDE